MLTRRYTQIETDVQSDGKKELRAYWDEFLKKCENTDESSHTIKEVTNVRLRAAIRNMDSIIEEFPVTPEMELEIDNMKDNMKNLPFDEKEHNFIFTWIAPDSNEGIFVGVTLRKHRHMDSDVCDYFLLWHSFKNKPSWWPKPSGASALTATAAASGALVGGILASTAIAITGGALIAGVGAAAAIYCYNAVKNKTSEDQ